MMSKKLSKEDSLRIDKDINKIYRLSDEMLGERGDVYAPSHAAPNQTPQSTFDEKLDEIIEYFVQERDAGFDKIHQRFLKGEITIEQQVQLSEIDWDKHISEAKAAITSLVLEENDVQHKFLVGEINKLWYDEELDAFQEGFNAALVRVVNLANKAAQQRSIITKEKDNG